MVKSTPAETFRVPEHVAENMINLKQPLLDRDPSRHRIPALIPMEPKETLGRCTGKSVNLLTPRERGAGVHR